MQSDAGKGSAPRPFSVDKETFDNNWERIFKRHEDLKGTVDKLNKQLDNDKGEKLKK